MPGCDGAMPRGGVPRTPRPGGDLLWRNPSGRTVVPTPSNVTDPNDCTCEIHPPGDTCGYACCTCPVHKGGACLSMLSCKEMERPSFDEYHMNMAFVASTRSTCPRRATGAVLVSNRRVIATGYNGSPRGLSHCPSTDKAGHPDCMEHGHCVRTVHAEVNAIIACAHGGASTQGATIYTTTFPCHRCIGPVINAGIVRIVYAEEYRDASHTNDFHAKSMAQARAAGIEIKSLLRKGAQP